MTLNKFITFCFFTLFLSVSLKQSCASDFEEGGRITGRNPFEMLPLVDEEREEEGGAPVEAPDDKKKYNCDDLKLLQFSPLSQAPLPDETILNMLRADIYAAPETPHVLELKKQVAAEKAASRRADRNRHRRAPSFGFAKGRAAADADWRATKEKARGVEKARAAAVVVDESATRTVTKAKGKPRHRGGKKERAKRERRAAAKAKASGKSL